MKTIVAILLFIFPCSLHAQLKKGQWVIGGLADFSHTNSDEGNSNYSHDSKVTNYRLMPGAGYFLMDRFCGGIRINISSMKTEENSIGISPVYSYTSSLDLNISGIGFSPFFRYYLLPAAKKVNVFVDASYTYNNETRKTTSYQKTIISGGTPSEVRANSKDKYRGNYYSIMAGPAIFIGRNVSFELSLGYTLDKTKGADQTTDRITFGTGFQVHFGK
jgi:hypothetical protein